MNIRRDLLAVHQWLRKVKQYDRIDFSSDSNVCLAPIYHPNITVVNSGPINISNSNVTASNSSISNDCDLNKLTAIPKFLPILRSTINLPNDSNQMPHIENEPVRILS